jgi:hypothetical protein
VPRERGAVPEPVQQFEAKAYWYYLIWFGRQATRYALGLNASLTATAGAG